MGSKKYLKKLKCEREIVAKSVAKSNAVKKKEWEVPNEKISFLLKENGRWIRFKDLFQLQKKNKTVTFRVSEDLLEELKKIAKKEKTEYQKLIRNLIIEYVAKKTT